jgi:hypothetical protein
MGLQTGSHGHHDRDCPARAGLEGGRSYGHRPRGRMAMGRALAADLHGHGDRTGPARAGRCRPGEPLRLGREADPQRSRRAAGVRRPPAPAARAPVARDAQGGGHDARPLGRRPAGPSSSRSALPARGSCSAWSRLGYAWIAGDRFLLPHDRRQEPAVSSTGALRSTGAAITNAHRRERMCHASLPIAAAHRAPGRAPVPTR